MRYLTCLPLLCLLLAAPLQAVEYHGLYHAEVETADQGAEARAAGMQQAMADVLLKISGTGRVLEDERLAESLQSASRFVQQYRYRSEAIPPEEQQLDEAGNPIRERLWLSVRFDQKSIDELLRRNGYTVWGTARPGTLIWLGVEQGGSRVLVGDNDSGLVRELIDAESRRRALPVILPLLDLIDQSRVRPVDVWGDFLDTIEQASQRYTPQAILIGRLYPAAGQWEVRWTLMHQGDVMRWQQRAAEVSSLIADGIGQTSEHLVQRFARSYATGSGSILLEVAGIDSLERYRRVLDYLAAVHGVTAVLAERVTPHAVRFRLQAEGGSEAVLQTVALGDVLEPLPQQPQRSAAAPLPQGQPENVKGTDESAAPVSPPAPQVMHYRLVP